MDLDTRSLELLEAVAAHGTLTAAPPAPRQPARAQPAALRARGPGQLRLFDRQGRRLVPTMAGRRLLQTTAVVLAELRAAARDLDDLRHGRNGVLRITSQCSTNYQWLPPVIADYAETLARRRGPGRGGGRRRAGDRPPGGRDRRRHRGQGRPPQRGPGADPAVRGRHGGRGPRRPPVGRPAPHRRRGLRGRPAHRVRQLRPVPVPALPLPIPPGGRPGRVVTTPPITDLAVELVVRPGRGRAARVGRAAVCGFPPDRRRADDRQPGAPHVVVRHPRQAPPHVDALVDVVRAHFAGSDAASLAARQ